MTLAEANALLMVASAMRAGAETLSDRSPVRRELQAGAEKLSADAEVRLTRRKRRAESIAQEIADIRAWRALEDIPVASDAEIATLRAQLRNGNEPNHESEAS